MFSVLLLSALIFFISFHIFNLIIQLNYKCIHVLISFYTVHSENLHNRFSFLLKYKHLKFLSINSQILICYIFIIIHFKVLYKFSFLFLFWSHNLFSSLQDLLLLSSNITLLCKKITVKFQSFEIWDILWSSLLSILMYTLCVLEKYIILITWSL